MKQPADRVVLLAWACLGLVVMPSSAPAAESAAKEKAPVTKTATKTPPALSAPELATLDLPPQTSSTRSATVPPQDARDPSVPPPAPGPVKFTGTPSTETIRKVIRNYAAHLEATEGAINIPDYAIRKMRPLKLKRLHDEVEPGPNSSYHVCADMTDTATGDELDVDVEVSSTGNQLSVANLRIHKIGGKPRFQYDKQGNLIPL